MAFLLCLAFWGPERVVAAPSAPRPPATTAVPVPSLPPASAVHVTADAAILMDADNGRVLWARNPRERRPMASTTKVMTALLALELGRQDATVEVSQSAASTPGSSAHLRAGERFTLAEMLKGLLLPSGNDAAVAIAEHVAGSTGAFAELMNQRAQQLGMLDTHFLNPHGLTEPQHFSSAYDLALLGRAALKLPAFAALVRTPEASMEGLDARQQAVVRALRNTNRLLLTYGWADGVKTGTTSAAGSCLVASATRNGHRLLAVVLHSHDRWGDALRLLEYGFSHFSFVRVATAGETLRTVPVQGGAAPRVGLSAGGTLDVAVAVRELPWFSLAWDLDPRVRAPVAAGQPLGVLVALVGDQVVGRVPLVAASAVPRQVWWRRMLVWAAGLLGSSGPGPGPEA